MMASHPKFAREHESLTSVANMHTMLSLSFIILIGSLHGIALFYVATSYMCSLAGSLSNDLPPSAEATLESKALPKQCPLSMLSTPLVL